MPTTKVDAAATETATEPSTPQIRARRLELDYDTVALPSPATLHGSAASLATFRPASSFNRTVPCHAEGRSLITTTGIFRT